MNTGIPAVSGEGAIGAVEPVSNPYMFPLNWPAHRVVTPDEQSRIRAAMARRERIAQQS